jgi:hypothetical protein
MKRSQSACRFRAERRHRSRSITIDNSGMPTIENPPPNAPFMKQEDAGKGDQNRGSCQLHAAASAVTTRPHSSTRRQIALESATEGIVTSSLGWEE